VKVAAIILAGGKSSRMGRDKATIEIDGTPMLRRIHDVVVGCHNENVRSIDEIYVVTPWIDRYRPILPIDCNFITETCPHKGPLWGFAQALSQIEADWVLLLACDLPNLSTAFIQNSMLVPSGCANNGLSDIYPESIAYLPKQEHGWEALCGFYRGNCLGSLLEYINGGGQSFQGWLKAEMVTELAIDNPQILLNCNTPADLAEIIAYPSPTPRDRR
jgi:molybdenum cofactor guanylyltransferase